MADEDSTNIVKSDIDAARNEASDAVGAQTIQQENTNTEQDDNKKVE